jgi:GNAT superfamily N-acetyltransferase
MGFKIRKANSADMPSVLACIKELAEFEKEENAVIITVEDLISDGFSDNPAFECFVAEVEGAIVGIALFYYRYSTWKGKTIHLEDLIVKEAYRGTGIGRALYDTVMKYAHDLNLKRVEWNVLDWNTPAVKFYESTGAKILDDWKVVQITSENLASYLNRRN